MYNLLSYLHPVDANYKSTIPLRDYLAKIKRISVGLRPAIPPSPGGRELEGGGDSGEMILDLFRPALSKVAGICSFKFNIVRKDGLKNFAVNIRPGKEN